MILGLCLVFCDKWLCGDFAGRKQWKKMLFILLFWLTHPRYDFCSPFETSEASEPCPGSAWRKTTQAALWRQRYLCVPRRREGEELFSASSREKSSVGYIEAPLCLASPYLSSTWPLWIAQEQPPGTNAEICKWTAHKNQISSSGLFHYGLHGTRHFILFCFISFHSIFIYAVQQNWPNH